MAIVVAYNAQIMVNGVDLSNHCKSVVIDDGQETKEATAMGNTIRVFRAGLGVPSITAEFHNDRASGSVEATLRGVVSITSTGFTVFVRPLNSATTAVNPSYTMESVLDGGLTVVNDSVGEIPSISATFKPYSTFTVSTTAT